MDDPLTIAIDWSRASLEGARSAYLEAVRNPWPSRYPTDVLPARQLIHVLHAPFQVSKGGVDLLPGDLPGAPEEHVNVLGVLLGLRAGIDLAENGPLEFVFWPDWDLPIRITCESDETICLGYLRQVLCSARRDWIVAVEAALDDARNWLKANLPEARSDAVLGEWLTGGPLPDVPNVVFPVPSPTEVESTPEPIAYESLSEALARLVPEAGTYIQKQIDLSEEDLPHVTCGDFAAGWLYQRAARGEVTDDLMWRLAAVLSRMCVSNERVQEVLYLSMLPIMVTHPVIAPLLAKHTDACLDGGIRGMGFKTNDDGSPFVWPPVARGTEEAGSDE